MKNASYIQNLPIPPSGRISWPWTEETPPLPPTMPDGSPWPKISIVTPSYNQAQYLEETIRSVLLQGYPNLEYIIMDGGSVDGSVEIINKYTPWLTYWKSAPDNGQSQALADGFKRSHGEIMAWLNSDDLYEPGTFKNVANAFKLNPDVKWLAGRCFFLDSVGTKKLGWGKPMEKIEHCFIWNNIMQPGVFWRRSLWKKINGIDVNLKHSMDYDLWFQFRHIQEFPFWIESPLATFRRHPESKSTIGGPHVALERKLIHDRNKDLLTSTLQRLRVIIMRRNFQAYRLLSKYNSSKSDKFLHVLRKSIGIAPWIILNRSFYLKLLKSSK